MEVGKGGEVGRRVEVVVGVAVDGTDVGVAVSVGRSGVSVDVGLDVKVAVGVSVGGAVLVGLMVAVEGRAVGVGESVGATQAHTAQAVAHKLIRVFIRLREAVP